MNKIVACVLSMFFTRVHSIVTRNDTCNSVTTVFEKTMDSKFPGDYSKNKSSGKMLYTQRMSLLHFHKSMTAVSLVWATIAMGVDSNSRILFGDKKNIELWKKLNPGGFENMKKYTPQIWTTYDSFSKEYDEDSIYVYKKPYGYAGHGITFQPGKETLKMVSEMEMKKDSDWVVQEFVMPKLHDNRKFHLRALYLYIIQPDGSRQAYMYKKMRMFVAKDDFSLDKLYSDEEDRTLMLMTNINITYEEFLKNPENKDVTFDWKRYLMDAESAIGEDEYKNVYDKILELHSRLFETVGQFVECKKTDVSIYNNSCYHIIASDIALDTYGEPHLLETNANMAIKKLWGKEEVYEFTSDAASLMNLPCSPYTDIPQFGVWSKI